MLCLFSASYSFFLLKMADQVLQARLARARRQFYLDFLQIYRQRQIRHTLNKVCNVWVFADYFYNDNLWLNLN